jgi:hypothetical protein
VHTRSSRHGTRGAKPTVGVAATETGWRPDPTGRHEGRYFVGGQPTDLIRDGNTEAVDPLGKQQLDQAGAVNISQSAAVSVPSRPGRRRLWWVLAAVVLVLGLVGAGVGVTLFLNRDRESVDDKYLAALRQSGLSESSTLTRTPSPNGKQVCRQLEHGARQQGCPLIRSRWSTTVRSSVRASMSWKAQLSQEVSRSRMIHQTCTPLRSRCRARRVRGQAATPTSRRGRCAQQDVQGARQ